MTSRSSIACTYMLKKPMFTIYLKNGEKVEVAEDELATFINDNYHLLQVQHKKMGKRRVDSVDQASNVSSK